MDNKKSKKKLFAIIGGSVLAFVLTIVVSVAVTLAYFGDQASNNTTINMGEALEFTEAGASVSASGASDDGYLPGDTVNFQVKAAIAQTTTSGYLRMKIELDASALGTDASKVNFDATKITVKDGDGESANVLGTLSTLTNGYYYLMNSTTTTTVESLDASGANGLNLVIDIPYVLDKTLTNAVAEKAIKVTVTLDTIQTANIDATITAVEEAFGGTYLETETA